LTLNFFQTQLKCKNTRRGHLSHNVPESLRTATGPKNGLGLKPQRAGGTTGGLNSPKGPSQGDTAWGRSRGPRGLHGKGKGTAGPGGLRQFKGPDPPPVGAPKRRQRPPKRGNETFRVSGIGKAQREAAGTVGTTRHWRAETETDENRGKEEGKRTIAHISEVGQKLRAHGLAGEKDMGATKDLEIFKGPARQGQTRRTQTQTPRRQGEDKLNRDSKLWKAPGWPATADDCHYHTLQNRTTGLLGQRVLRGDSGGATRGGTRGGAR
jgi:hypothetical protein